MKQLPQNRNTWTQQNVSDIAGDLYATKGIDLVDNLGKVRVGKRLIAQATTTDFPAYLTDIPVAFREVTTSLGNQILTIAGTGLFASTADYPSAFGSPPGTFPVDLTTTNSDLEVYNSDLYITGAQNLYKLPFGLTNVSTSLYSSLGSASRHSMCAFQGKLYITNNGNLIYSWDGSSMTTSGSYSLTIGTPSKNVITFIRAANNRIWIGTTTSVNSSGARGYVYEWDGTATTVSKEHRLESNGAVSCVVKDDIPYIMDTNGRLLMWNGGTFKEIARLNRRKNQLLKPLSGVASWYVHPNGMTVVNGRINMVIDGSYFNSTGSMDEPIPSGVWEYDENIGLYHKHAFSINKATDTLTDFGATRIYKAGAMQEVNYPDSSASRNGTFVAGASTYSDATTVVSGIFSDDSNDVLQKAGYLITPKIEATDGSVYNLPVVQSTWQALFTNYRKLLNSTDKFVTKYRTEEKDAVEASITWQSPTTFIIPTGNITISDYWTSGTGGEVEIMQGIGAGKCAHITNVLTLNGYYVVTLDETFTGATGTAMARFSNWKKLSATTPNNQTYKKDVPGVNSSWIQFKIWMLFTGRNEIERLLISNSAATLPQ